MTFFLRRFFTSLSKESLGISKESAILLNFRRKLSALEYISSSMQVPLTSTRKLSTSELQNNRIVKTFFSSDPDEVSIYEHLNKVSVPDTSINYPRNAWSQVVLPLSKNLELRNKFVRFYTNKMRVGRILEVLDYVATHTSYVFCHSEPFSRTSTNVTLSMDNMHFFKPIFADKDLIICAYPTYNGNSTIEIRIDLYQDEDKDKNTELVASTHFVMASRDIQTHKAKKVPQLAFDNEEEYNKCLLRYELGKIMQEKRKLNSNNSLFRTSPSPEESQELHSIFARTNSIKNSISIEQTKMSKNLIMHLQDRNLHGKAFGGMMMREAFEIGWLTAHAFCQGKFPEIHHIDDLAFISPVDIGSLLKFEAKITFTQGNLLHVVVELIKNNLNGEEIKASELHLTLINQEEVRNVFPEKYSDGMLYLEAKRRLKHLLENVKF